VQGAVPTRTAHFDLAIDAMAILAVGILVFRRYSPRAAEYL
jgi:hypothetical protein